MKQILKSKLGALSILILIIIIIVLSFNYRQSWWSYIDIFFFFIAAFSHLMALTLHNQSVLAARKLDKIAFWCMTIAIISFLSEAVAYYIIFN